MRAKRRSRARARQRAFFASGAKQRAVRKAPVLSPAQAARSNDVVSVAAPSTARDAGSKKRSHAAQTVRQKRSWKTMMQPEQQRRQQQQHQQQQQQQQRHTNVVWNTPMLLPQAQAARQQQWEKTAAAAHGGGGGGGGYGATTSGAMRMGAGVGANRAPRVHITPPRNHVYGTATPHIRLHHPPPLIACTRTCCNTMPHR